MNKRSRLAALVGAGLLTFALVGAASAAAPTYTIVVDKSADPESVPAGGGDVEFTITVHNSGTGDFLTVNVADSLGGCTLGAPTGDDGDGKLEGAAGDAGETWTYTCTVNVTPDTTNTATVNACHDQSACNNESHDATGSDSVTVTLEGDDGGSSSGQPPTDTAFGTTGTSGPTDIAWLLIAALGVLLGSIVVLSPARVGRRR